MDEDKNPSQTQDDGQADQSAASNSTVNLENVDPRLIIEEETTEENPQEAETPQEQEPEVVEPEEEPQAQTQEEETPNEQQPQTTSRRENKRIAELTKKLQEANQRQWQPNQQPQPQQQPQQIIQEGDYNLNEINGMAQQYGDQRYAEGIQQANNSNLFMTRLEIDAPKVETKYPFLNPRSDNFDPGIADWTTQMFYKTVGLKTKSDGTFSVDNPNIRYEEFVDGFMEAVETVATSKSADSKQNLIKQAAQTGVRPNTVVKKGYTGEDPNKMTLEQLRAKVNQELGIS